VNAYGLVLFIHSYLRWAVLGLCLVVIVRAFAGWMRSREWQALDERLHVALVASVDLQFLIGLILYVFLSPIVQAFFMAPGPAMKDATLRFFGMEHIATMLIATALIHISRARSKKASTARLRQRRVWTLTLAGLLLMLISVPWPFLDIGRPWFRAFA
jgi:hypothetical protein